METRSPAVGATVNFSCSKAVELIGVYDADGGWRGELAYFFGHLLGRQHCSLCDITNSPVRRKASWDAMVAGLGVPFSLLHRDERPLDVASAAGDHVPAVVARLESGELIELLGPRELDEIQGDVTAFRDRLLAALRERAISLR
jgi:hypothetical protein